jgi:catalase
LEDFILREKITHFDHERIPERIVHARGSGAHGFFEVTQSLSQYTKADFLQRVGDKTPVFVRFSTVCRWPRFGRPATRRAGLPQTASR